MLLIKNLFITLFLILGTNAFAKTFPTPITPYISDYANLLDPETEARITEELVKLRQTLDLEMAVVTIETRFDYGQFDSIEEFTAGLFDQWRFGRSARNDGVLVLISHFDGEMRIEVGSSYGSIYDKRMGLVIQNYFIPHFKNNQLSEGIEVGVYETINRLQPTYDITDPKTLKTTSLVSAIKRTTFWRTIEDKYMLFVFLGIITFLFFETRMRDILVGLRRCPNCNRRQLHHKRTIKKRRIGKEQGKEIVEAYCSSCHYNAREQRSIPSLNEPSNHI